MRYVFLNRAPGVAWDQNRPETIVDDTFREPMEKLGSSGRAELRPGLSFVFSIFNGPPERIAESLERLLSLAEKHDTPILPVLDGQNWWDGRPDLWNWWDPSQPGYDPRNVHNVEWIGPSPDHALKIAWRNWGRQIRVLPPPNLLSPAYRSALRAELERHTATVTRWMRRLPKSRGVLCPGIKVGWEASIGINAYHYPGGNALLLADPKDDPTGGLDLSRDFAGGLAVQGYAAREVERRRDPGPVTVRDHERIVGDTLGFLAARCRSAGLRADEVFVHAGGQYAPWEKHVSHRTAIGRGAVPGWSLYNTDPRQAGDLGDSLRQASRRDWCAAEWLSFAPDVAGWERDLRATLGFEDCRFVSIYNWEGIKENPAALEGIRRVLKG